MVGRLTCRRFVLTQKLERSGQVTRIFAPDRRNARFVVKIEVPLGKPKSALIGVGDLLIGIVRILNGFEAAFLPLPEKRQLLARVREEMMAL